MSFVYRKNPNKDSKRRWISLNNCKISPINYKIKKYIYTYSNFSNIFKFVESFLINNFYLLKYLSHL